MEKLIQAQKDLNTLPHTISKNQFYKICHISKRHAKYLLDSGLVKCVDSGKKTCKYKIETKEVWGYLIDRELNPDKYRAPEGYYCGNGGRQKRKHRRAPAFAPVVIFHFTDQERAELLAVWTSSAEQYPDLMNTSEVCELTGYTTQTIQRWCRRKTITSFIIQGKLLIPKATLIEYLASNEAASIIRKSSKHLELLYQFIHNK